jgi:sulfite exporter TauE/SafE
LAGVFWGIGHTMTLFIFGILLIVLKMEISEKWSLSLEFLVGIMLVYLGVSSMAPFKKKKIHFHEHRHDGFSHNHFHDKHDHGHPQTFLLKPALIGMVHGLAGSAAMVLLTMSTVTSVWQGAIYILVFGMGTVIGMLFFTTIIGLPFVLSFKRVGLNTKLIKTAGLVSMLFGFYFMYHLGINEGLFKLWLS